MAQAAAMKSTMYVWEGVDKTGKRVKGEMSGESDSLVKATLRRQGVNPLRVKKKPKSLFEAGGKVTSKDITVFSRQLAMRLAVSTPTPLAAFSWLGLAESTASGEPRRSSSERTRTGPILGSRLSARKACLESTSCPGLEVRRAMPRRRLRFLPR